MKSALQVLNELKETELIQDYAIGGSVAALKWTEPFLTQDLGIFVVLKNCNGLPGIGAATPTSSSGKSKAFTFHASRLTFSESL